MTVEPERIERVLAEIASPDPRRRDLAAEEVADLVPVLGPAEGESLSRALEMARTNEVAPVVRESQLNALVQLSAAQLVPRSILEQIIANGRRSDEEWADEYLDSLREDLDISAQRTEG